MGHFYSVLNPPIIPGILAPNNFPCSFPLSLPSLPSTPQPWKRRNTSHQHPTIADCSPPLSRPLERSSLPSTSRPAKRRKTSCQQPTTSNATQSDDREECENPSYSYTWPQVFLSHSGKQKNFVEQLYEDLKRANITCFFDKDPQSLPKGENFPSRIFQAAMKCKVGVVVLSEEFVSSKWPMQELSAFVKAKNSTNPNLIILPLFFGLSTDSLFQKLQNKDSLKRFWQNSLKVQKRKIDLNEWVTALEALRPINGVNYVEQEGEVAYRAQIVGHIRRHLRPNLKYEESYVQGKERLCQEVAELFKNTPCRESGVKIAGLYGVGGIGKTTLAQILCNFYSNDFDGKVFHVEFGKGMPVETLKAALSDLTDAPEPLVNSVGTIQQGWPLFKQRMYGKKVFLALDNISDLAGSIEEALMYLRAVCSAGTQSMILLTARSSTILKRFIPEGERSCMHVPSLQEEEAMEVFLQLTGLRVSDLSGEAKDIARKYVQKCYFSWNCVTYGTYNKQFCAYHPVVLKVFGAYLYDKFDSCADLSQWIDVHNSGNPCRSGDTQEEVFSMFEDSFQSLREEHRMVFMLLCLYLPESNMTSEVALNWLALACSRDVQDIKSAVIGLKRKGFVERTNESGLPLYIHDLLLEFAANRAEGRGEWISLRERDEIPVSLQEALSSGRPRFSAMKIDNCHFQCPGFVNDKLFRNILVLHLQHMPQLKILNLSPMRIVRSITIIGCGGMEKIHGLENLTSLAYFRIEACSANIQLSGIERLVALQYLKVHASLQQTVIESLPCRWASFPPLQCFSNVGSIQHDHFEKDTRQLHLSGCLKLQTIEFSHCNITEIDFSECLELRRIELRYCENLSELPSLTGLTKLRELRLEGMHSLKELPSLTGLTQLGRLLLQGMHNLKELPNLTGLTKLGWLLLEGMHSLKELPSLTGLSELRRLHLKGMHSLKELPSLTGLTKLEWLLLEGMHSLKELPSLTGLTELRLLFLEGMHSLKELPSLTGLSELGRLQLEGMHSLEEFPSLTGLTKLQWLELEGMHSLKELPSLTRLTKLEWLHLQGMHSLKELPSLTGLINLRSLHLEGMHSLKGFPSLTGLTKLSVFSLEGMHSLKELPNLTGLTMLHELRLGGMHSLKELPSFTGLVNLRYLKLEGMHNLKEFPNLTGLTHLDGLELEGMLNLQEAPNLTGLTNLRYLVLGDGMRCMESRTELSGVRSLRLEEMHGLEDLPNLKHLLLVGAGMHCLEDIPRGLRDIDICYVDFSDERLKSFMVRPEDVKAGVKHAWVLDAQVRSGLTVNRYRLYAEYSRNLNATSVESWDLFTVSTKYQFQGMGKTFGRISGTEYDHQPLPLDLISYPRKLFYREFTLLQKYAEKIHNFFKGHPPTMGRREKIIFKGQRKNSPKKFSDHGRLRPLKEFL